MIFGVTVILNMKVTVAKRKQLKNVLIKINHT